MLTPLSFVPPNGFWDTVNARLPANQGHAQNIFPHGPYVGTVGEVAFEYWFRDKFPNRPIRHVGETWHDYVIATKTAATNLSLSPPAVHPRDQLTVEVKTKLRTTFPLSDSRTKEWEVSVPDYLLEHLRQTEKPHVFFAASVQSKLMTPTTPQDVDSIVMLGWIPYGTFQNWKVWIPKGTRMGGGRASPKDMWNVFVRQLHDARNL